MRSNDLVLVMGDYGGIFRSTASSLRIPAQATLPLPGASGSLSDGTKNIVIDTTKPYVMRVYTSSDSGTYGAGTIIMVYTDWSAAVVWADVHT